MKIPWPSGWRWGGAALALLALPPVRAAMESSMTTHMLAQYPALVLTGVVLGRGLPQGCRRRLGMWNHMGISGLAFTTLALAVLMIPRVLDLALVDARVDALKYTALVSCGLALAVSWRPAGTVVQAFFLGNVLPMTAAVGLIYQQAPLQLCNAYRVDEQQMAGLALVWVALFLGIGWLSFVFGLLIQKEASGQQALIRRNPPAVERKI